MDKSDYTHMGHPRYLDLERITDDVLAAKRLNGDKKLIRVRLVSQEERYPPHNNYEYTFAK